MSESNSIGKLWLFLSNVGMQFGFARVLKIFFQEWKEVQDPSLTICESQLNDAVILALSLSFLELFNASIGLTRSKPHQVLLFSIVRFGVQLLVAPLLSCSDWRHLVTVLAWSLGDFIRFFCFALDVMVPNAHLAKAVRYTVGPMLFPIGALGEMLMVVEVAQNDRPLVYIAAALWPLGFFPLFMQLLKQRNKFFKKWKEESAKQVAEKKK